MEVNIWERKEEKKSLCPGTTGQVLTRLLFPEGQIGRSPTSKGRWPHSRTRTAAQ